jgi:hypothetical protein
MMSSRLRIAHRWNRLDRGFALLIVLMAVVILLLLYFADLSIFTTGPLPQRKHRGAGTNEPMPWEEESRLVAAGQTPQGPNPGQPAITKAVSLTGPVTFEGEPRGQIVLNLRPNGYVDGRWQCRYSYRKSHYGIQAEFVGNIDPSKTYIDRDGQPVGSKLFFITKGRYTQTSEQADADSGFSSEGTVYVTGWVEPNFSASGQITITTDKSWYASYPWSTKP